MTERKRYLLRIDPRLYTALEKWAADDLRSVNAQIEFVLAQALRKAGRSKEPPTAGGAPASAPPQGRVRDPGAPVDED